MQKRLYIIIILLFAAEYTIGQGRLKFGVLFDPTITWLQSDNMNVTPKKIHAGFNFGVSVDYYFANNYAFATGVSLFNTGGTLTYTDGVARFRTNQDEVSIKPGSDITYRIQYVKIPLGLKFKTHRIGRYVYFANLGVNPMARALARADFTDENDKEYDSVNVNNEVNFFNMGWFFGGGASYSLGGNAAIFAGINFMSTFIDMTSRDFITSRNLSLRIGVLF